jgi:2-hydroxy-4-carboxymuconate semialdehyde hemiacetal dehydrogenase
MRARRSLLNAGKRPDRNTAADNLPAAEAVARRQRETGLVAMVGHTRRFNPSHQWIHERIVAGDLNIQHMDVQTFFFRRRNINALGQPRSWTDHLLWHHAAHTVDLFAWQTGEIIAARAQGDPPRARHRDGHVDPTQIGDGCHLHAGAVVQQ